MNLKEACALFLQETGLDYEDTGPGSHGQLQWMHHGSRGDFWLCLQALPRQSLLLVSAVYPDFVPRKRLDQVMELAHRLNCLPLPGVFVLDVEWGQLRFEQRLEAGRDGVLDTDGLRESLTRGADALDALQECLQAVCIGQMTAREVFGECAASLTALFEDSSGDPSVARAPQPAMPSAKPVTHADAEDGLGHDCGWRPPAALLSEHTATLCALPPAVASLDTLIGLRHENQDYGVAFRQGHGIDAPVIIAIADGLGGHPGGRAASFLACSGAVSAAARSTGLTPHNLLAMLRDGAECTLSRFAQRQPPETCLTTLILAVVTADRYHLAWLGDGGAAIRRQDGQWLEAMIPHRGSSGMQNHVGAFLGARRHGFWSISEFERHAGDLLVAGSDGVMERTFQLEAFFRKPLREVAQGACLQDAMSRYLESCVSRHPRVFDDNLTLACLLTPTCGE